MTTSPWGPTLFATVIAFATGYAVIAWFMKFISTKSFMPFVWYRIALGIVIIALVATGALSPHAARIRPADRDRLCSRPVAHCQCLPLGLSACPPIP